MSEKQNGQLAITVYAKYYRICIYRSVLAALGNPRFIHLGVNDQATGVMVLGKWGEQQRALRVHLNKNGTFMVHSKALIEEIQAASGMMTEPGSYRLRGRLLEAENAVVFPVKDMEKL